MELDPVMVAIVVVLLVMIFAGYIFVRRIATSFKRGLQEGGDGR